LTEVGLEKIELKNAARKIQEEYNDLKESSQHRDSLGSRNNDNQRKLESMVAKLTEDLESQTTRRVKQEEHHVATVKYFV
jgi:hypothetical protein